LLGKGSHVTRKFLNNRKSQKLQIFNGKNTKLGFDLRRLRPLWLVVRLPLLMEFIDLLPYQLPPLVDGKISFNVDIDGLRNGLIVGVVVLAEVGMFHCLRCRWPVVRIEVKCLFEEINGLGSGIGKVGFEIFPIHFWHVPYIVTRFL
jgi:hypothetical protein